MVFSRSSILKKIENPKHTKKLSDKCFLQLQLMRLSSLRNSREKSKPIFYIKSQAILYFLE